MIATKFNTLSNYEKASVIIEKKKNIILNSDAYTKREKIYNKQSL